MKRSLVLVAIVLVAGTACRRERAPALPEGPVAWSVSARADKSSVQVGEDLALTVTVRHPPGGEFVPPLESAFEPFTVIGLSEEKPSVVEDRLVYRLAAYRLPGQLEIPALEVRVRNEEGQVDSLETTPIPVEVVTSLTPDVTEIHDIKEPLPLVVRRDWSLLWWLLGALAAALVAYIIYRKLRKTPDGAAPVWTPPLPAPDVEALEALRRLAASALLERGEAAAFHAELAEIVKRYAGRRFEVPYLERTTAEILGDLRSAPLAAGPRVDLRAVLDACDLVKFARVVPAEDEARRALGMAERLVAQTRPAPPPSAESLEATA